LKEDEDEEGKHEEEEAEEKGNKKIYIESEKYSSF